MESRGPLRVFEATADEPFSLRPSLPARTTSSSSVLRSVQPRIVLLIQESQVPQDLLEGVRELATNAIRQNVYLVANDGSYPSTSSASYAWHVKFTKDEALEPRSLKIQTNAADFTSLPDGASDFAVTVSYCRPIEAFRALGHILGASRNLATFTHPDMIEDDDNNDQAGSLTWSTDVSSLLNRQEDCLFETVGVMIDCSRNGVLRVSGAKMLLRQMALMGSNMLQLYCEDTYKLPNEPFFGYFRGPYSFEELKEIDDYAYSLNIEVIPCIQTLGHLGQMLQWPRFGGLRDTTDVILAESSETYVLLENMIATISAPLRSKRIHIGMDEAHGVSEGRYRQVFGYKDSTTVFVEHLRKVNAICQRKGLQPMIWSDMLFCLPAKNNALSGYYDLSTVISEDLTSSIPPEVHTVFWDYYHTDSLPYSAKISQHWQLAGKAPWMASGIWTWSRFWTALPFTFATVRAMMKASKDPQWSIKGVMTTIWGDEGNEMDLYSALPGILYHADHAYTTAEEVDVALLKRKFDGICGADFDDYVYASKLDDTKPESQPIDSKTHYTPNLAKFLLWEEPAYSFLSPQYAGFDLETHFGTVATYLEQAVSEDFTTMNKLAAPHSVSDFPLNKRLVLPGLLARILSLKCHLRERLAQAYATGDTEELVALAGPDPSSRLYRLRQLVSEMHDLHRENWFELYKPFGWEVLDLRYGGLEARLETLHKRLVAFLDPADDKVTRVEELEVPLETIYAGQGANLMLDYARASRPQFI